MTFPFTKPPTFSELGKEGGGSYWAVDRMDRAGIVPTRAYPDCKRVDTDWANRFIREGLTPDEMRRYRAWSRRFRAERDSKKRQRDDVAA